MCRFKVYRTAIILDILDILDVLDNLDNLDCLDYLETLCLTHQLASAVERHVDVGTNVVLANEAVESGAFKRLLNGGRNA